MTSTTAPNDGTPLGELSDADLLREVARRRLAKGNFNIDAIEELAGAAQRDLGEETLAAAMAALPPEDDKPKACPKCRQLVPVKAKNRLRHILTTAGELRPSFACSVVQCFCPGLPSALACHARARHWPAVGVLSGGRTPMWSFAHAPARKSESTHAETTSNPFERFSAQS